MFKVMIVDDEIYVVALIRKMISWEKYQMQVEATANDGVTALELVRKINPDLVVVDIRMPGYDGVSFMDKVREFNRNVRFIVISGHKQFDYARGALRNNVEDYLLKPISKEELEKAIKHAQEKLIASREKNTKLKEMQSALDNSKKQLRRLFIESVLNGEMPQLPKKVEEINKRFSTEFREGIFQMVAISFDTSIDYGGLEQEGLPGMTFAEEIRSRMELLCYDLLKIEKQMFSIFLINYAKEQEENVIECLKQQAMNGMLQGKKFDNLLFRICVAKEVKDIKEIEVSIHSMHRLLLARTTLPEGEIIEEKNIHEEGMISDKILNHNVEQFEQALVLLDIEEISRCIKESFSRAYYDIKKDALLYYKVFNKLVEKIYTHFQNMGIINESAMEFQTRFEEYYINVAKSSDYAQTLIERVAELLKENRLTDSREVPAVRIAKRYIREHYKEDISLPMLADLANVSAVYLSRLFKKNEGINFLDYLNQYRIEVAKKMLLDIHFNINEVAELSGFKNAKYFSKIFKKIVGITPSEYRRRHFGKEDE